MTSAASSVSLFFYGKQAMSVQMNAHRTTIRLLFSCMLGILIMGTAMPGSYARGKEACSVDHIRSQLVKYVPAKLGVERRLLSASDRRFLAEVIAAAKLMDDIFLQQVWEDNVAIRTNLAARDLKETGDVLSYFDLNAGPFDRLDGHRSFVDIGIASQPPTAGFYPPDLTLKEWNEWLKQHPTERNTFISPYTVIRRKGDGLVAVPYAQEYARWLERAASHLKRAASLCNERLLKKYLVSRAAAFASNDYYQSDIDWMKLDNHHFEIVIGPYEVYEDRFMGYKASFEAYVAMVDRAESARLKKIASMLPEFERRLPIDDGHRNARRGSLSPIVVADLIFSSGEAKAGIQTIAFNLPNDERVREAFGSKKVMLKNVSEAKFNAILVPIARIALDPRGARDVSFKAFFNHTLMHEMSHGMGPGTIEVNGRATTVNLALKELYSVIEEAKADTLALYNNLHLVDGGHYPASVTRQLFATYLAGLVRSMRFGIAEAHGAANAIQFNYLFEKGAIIHHATTHTFGYEEDAMRQAILDLARELLMIEARGDYAHAKKFVRRYRRMPRRLNRVIKRLAAVPVDIRPVYTID